jgi:hypothetical protein
MLSKLSKHLCQYALLVLLAIAITVDAAVAQLTGNINGLIDPGTTNIGVGLVNDEITTAAGTIDADTSGSETLYDLTGATININTGAAALTGIVVAVYASETDDAEIRAGNISITGNVNGGTGILVGFGYDSDNTTDFAGILDIKNITVINNGAGEAVGVGFIGTDSAVSGELYIGNITVTAKGNNATAYGIYVDGDLTPTDGTLGKINVTSTNGYAGGIVVEGAATLMLNRNITVNAKKEAIGVAVRGGEIYVAGNVNVMAKGGTSSLGLYSDGNLGLLLVDGAKLTTNSVAVDDGYLMVAGKGFAQLGTVNVDGDFYIGNGTDTTTIAFNLTGSNLGDINIEDKVNIWLYGNGSLANFDSINFEGSNWNSVRITSIDPFFNYWATENSGVVNIGGGLRSQAYMSDGFLAAMGIHNRYAAWNAVRDRMVSSFGYGGMAQVNSIYRGQMPHYNNMIINPTVGGPYRSDYSDLPTAWVNYIGRSNTSRSSYNGQNWKLSTNGVQAGTDILRTRFEQFGVLFGYEGGKMTNASDSINANDYYLGVYAGCILMDDSDIRGSFALGWQDYKMNRLGLGGVYDSHFKGNTAEFNVEVGRRISDGPGSFRPVVGLDIMNNNLKGTSESGGLWAVTYDKTNLTQVFVRAGAELRYQMPIMTLNSGVYYAYDVNGANLNTYASMVNNPSIGATLAGTKPGRSLLLFNVGGSYQITDFIALTGGYEGQAVLDGGSKGTMHAGHVGGALRW